MKKLVNLFSKLKGISLLYVGKIIFISACFLVGVGAIVYGFIGLLKSTESELTSCSDYYLLDEPEGISTASSCISWAIITVDVSGAVENPGIYRLGVNTRVADAIEQAGGLSKQADLIFVQNKLNLAQKLIDGEKIIIPFEKETSEVVVVDSDEAAIISGSEGGNNLISINDASLKELQTLTGIGEVRAQAIIDGRPYTSLKQLVEKSVITENSFEKIKDSIGL